jgi:hypothetical protein
VSGEKALADDAARARVKSEREKLRMVSFGQWVL